MKTKKLYFITQAAMIAAIYIVMTMFINQDGLVHISEICDRFIRHPLEAVSIGDIVDMG